MQEVVFEKKEAYAIIKTLDYPLWNSIELQEKIGKSDNHIGEIFKISGIYRYNNGRCYAELYTDQQQFIGLINTNACTISNVPAAPFEPNEYLASIVKENYPLWQDLTLQTYYEKSTTHFKQTVQVLGSYRHFNGLSYLSIYDAQHCWLGYINSAALKKAKFEGEAKVGSYFAVGQKGKIKHSLQTWSDLSFEHFNDQTLIEGLEVFVRGQYYTLRGESYYTICTKDKERWLGYVHEKDIELI